MPRTSTNPISVESGESESVLTSNGVVMKRAPLLAIKPAGGFNLLHFLTRRQFNAERRFHGPDLLAAWR